MALLNPGAQRQLVAAFRAAAHASTDDHFIEQARGAEQALAEDRLDVERVRQNFSRLVEAMCAEAALVQPKPEARRQRRGWALGRVQQFPGEHD